MEPHRLDRHRLRSSRHLELQHAPLDEPLLREIGLRVDDHLALVAVGAGDAADQQMRHRSRARSLRPSPGNRRSPWCRRSRRRRSPACGPRCAVRPCRPITRPMSPGAIVNSTNDWPRASRSVTLTASGLSASALAIASTTARARLTTRWRPKSRRRRPAAPGHAVDQRADRVGRLRAELHPVGQPLAIELQVSGLVRGL